MVGGGREGCLSNCYYFSDPACRGYPGIYCGLSEEGLWGSRAFCLTEGWLAKSGSGGGQPCYNDTVRTLCSQFFHDSKREGNKGSYLDECIHLSICNTGWRSVKFHFTGV